MSVERKPPSAITKQTQLNTENRLLLNSEARLFATLSSKDNLMSLNTSSRHRVCESANTEIFWWTKKFLLYQPNFRLYAITPANIRAKNWQWNQAKSLASITHETRY